MLWVPVKIVCDDSDEYPQPRVWKKSNGFRMHSLLVILELYMFFFVIATYIDVFSKCLWSIN